MTLHIGLDALGSRGSDGGTRRDLLLSLSRPLLLTTSLLLVCAAPSFGQCTPVESRPAPSRGEQDEKPGGEQTPGVAIPKPRPWNKVDGAWGDATLSGALFIDFFRYHQDDQSRQQVGDLGDFEVPEIRTLRLGGIGTLNFKRPWSWIFYAMYRGFDRGWDRSQDDTWTIYDLAVTIPIYSVGKLSIGKMKEPFSLERNMLALSLPFMERAAGNDALLQSRNTGFKLSSSALGERMTWSGGFFPGFLERDDVLSQADQFIGRVTTLPVDGRDGGGLVHFGLSGRYSYRRGSAPVTARYRGTPESFSSPNFLDTGELSMERVFHFGLEGAFRKGPFWASSEWITARLSLPDGGDPRFHSVHVQAAYFLTGEHRTYDRGKGVFGTFIPRLGVTGGGPGLWEVAFRYSHTDLQDAGVAGGVLDRWTCALSWTPEGLIRVELNYGIARLDKDATTGNTQILQGRLQLFF